MKIDPSEAAIRRRMQPGMLSRDGFLGDDQRNIAEIIAADQAELANAEISNAELADLLDELHQAASAGFGDECCCCNGKLKVRLIEVAGRLPCPFACGSRARKAVLEVQLPQQTLQITPLQSHLIRAHGFFQGTGSPFRLEPAAAIALYRLCRS